MSSTIPLESSHRVREGFTLISALVRLHPRKFAVALTGGIGFALTTVASSIAIRWVIDNVIIPRFERPSVGVSALLAGIGLVVGIGILRSAAVVLRRSFAGIFQWRSAESLSSAVAERYLRQPMSWFQGRSEGDLIARAGVDVEATVGVLAPIPFATGTAVLLVVSTAWLLWLDPAIGAVALVAGPLLLWVNTGYQRRVERPLRAAQHELGQFSGAVHESLDGVQLVKAYGAEERETARLAEIAARVRDQRVRAITLRATFEAVLEWVPAVTNVTLVMVGALRVSSGDLTIGELTAAVFLFALLAFPLRLIGYVLSELPRSQAGWARIREILDAPLEADPAERIGTAPEGVGVWVRGLSHRPGPGLDDTLHEVDLTVPAGQVLALVGATGSGKSTLIEVLGGLRDHRGEISLAAGARAVVLQEAFLFAGTIRANICLGQEFSDEQISAALDWSEASEFIRDLPQGIDTVVGERGVSLSGGQRQRVALARALVRRPTVLLCDDVTSALDPSTEIRVLENLRTHLRGATVVMVASRPSTIRLADQVAYLSEGRLRAHGAHEDLMAAEPGYREIVDAFETDRAAGRGDSRPGTSDLRGAP